MTKYDSWLVRQWEQIHGAPLHYLDCVACEYCYPRADVAQIKELDDRLIDVLVHKYGDELDQFICMECVKLIKIRE